MAKLNIVIGDYDLSYLEALSNFLNINYSDKAFTSIVTDVKYMDSHLRGKKTDILLINPDFYNKEMKKRYNINSIIFFTEDPYAVGYEFPAVNKYQQGESLFDEIMNAYALQNPNSFENIIKKYDSTSVITFYSPIGGIGKTSLAVSTAIAIAEEGNQVLYLNLEDIQSTSMFFVCSEEKRFSDFLYLVKEKSSKIGEKYLEIRNTDTQLKIDYFSPADSAMDIEELNPEDMRFLIESILKLNMYSHIVIDLSSKFNSQYQTILDISKNVVIPIGQDVFSSIKCEQFLRQIYSLSKYHFVINKFRPKDGVLVKNLLDKNNVSSVQTVDYDYLLAAVRSGEDIRESFLLKKAAKELINNLGLLG